MKRLLILQMCRFGDILQTTPMLRGIRRHFPETDVTLVVNDAFRHVPIPSSLYDSLRFLPYSEIVEMLAKDSDAWPAAVGRLGAFVESLGDDPFDLTLNLTHSDLASFLAAAIPSHEVRGGLVAPDRSRTVRGEVMTYFWASQLSRAQGCFNLVDLHNWTAGVPSERLALEVEIPGEARARMNTWMSEQGILGRPFIAVQLGASDERKRWPPERFGEAINQLEPDLGEILLVGTAAERVFGERAKARITRPVHDSLGQSSIVELAVLLESASLLLTNDTGTMHVATAVGTKVVDVSTGPVFAHETGPYGEGHLVIEPQMPCFPCAGGSECHHLACRDAFTPEDIAALVRHAFGRGPVPRPAGARILEGGFGESGRLEYRPIWAPTAELQDLVRPLTAKIWEPTLLPPSCSHPVGLDTMSLGGRAGGQYEERSVGHDLPPAVVEATHAALVRVAGRARRAAKLTRTLPRIDPSRRDGCLMKIGRELDALRVEAELDPACRSIVAYLRVRLDSTADTDIAQLSHVYVEECEGAADRAQSLAEGLAVDAIDSVHPAEAV